MSGAVAIETILDPYERTFSGARLDVLIFRLRSYHVLNHVHCRRYNRQKSEKHMTFLVQAGTFLCFQAGRSSATRSSASDLTVNQLPHAKTRLVALPIKLRNLVSKLDNMRTFY